MIVGDGAGLVNVPALKGIHYAMTSGMLAAETAVDAVGPGQTSWAPGALEGYDRALRESYVWSDLKRVRNVRPAFKHGFLGGSLRAGAAILTLGMLPGNKKLESDADVPVEVGNRAARYPAPDGKLVFDKLSSVYLSGNKTRDDAPSHIRVQRAVPLEVAETLGAHVPRAGVRDRRARRRRPGGGRGHRVELRPVRRDHREGRPADPARGRRGPRILRDVGG